MGEVFKVNSEPQKDTQAQRSWLYSTDPMVQVMQQRMQESQLNKGNNHTPESSKAQHKSYGRKDTCITTIRSDQNGVFVDDLEH